MIKESIYFYEDIGKVTYRKKTGVKRLTIRITMSGEVNVTIPFLISFREAENFVIRKSDWINKTKIKLERSKHPPVAIEELNGFVTAFHTIRIIRYDGNKIMRKFINDYVEIYIPFHADTENPVTYQFISSTITETFRHEAKIYLPVRVKYLADLHGFTFNRISIKKMRTRWGSCSGKNNINLNLFLMSIPEILRDYVILHELVHTVEKNHGKRFWNSLLSICPEAINLRKEIKKYPAVPVISGKLHPPDLL